MLSFFRVQRLLGLAAAVAVMGNGPVLLGGDGETEKRRNGWVEQLRAFDEQDRTNPPPRGAMLFVGSSSVRLWKTLESDFSNYVVIRRGFGGAHLEDVVHETDRLVLRHVPRIVLVYAGDNDVAAGKSPQRVLEDFRALVLKVHGQQPGIRIGFIAIKPSVARRALMKPMETANDLVRQYAAEDDRLFYLDVFTPMLDSRGEPRPDLLVEDGLHLNASGYRLWTKAIITSLEENPSLASTLNGVRRVGERGTSTPAP